MSLTGNRAFFPTPPHQATDSGSDDGYHVVASKGNESAQNEPVVVADDKEFAGLSADLAGSRLLSNESLEESSLNGELSKVESIKAEFNRQTAATERRAQSALKTEFLTVGVVGDSAIGKTALIRRLLGSSEVLKYETMPANASTTNIETYRSTTVHPEDLPAKEYPWNLIFVDTPGFGTHTDALLTIRPVVSYQLSRFAHAHADFAIKLPFPALQHYHRCTRHGQLDVVLYGLLHRVKPVDVEYMRQLSKFANVVPVILKCDTMTKAQLVDLKVHVLETVAKEAINIVTFGMSVEELIEMAKHGVEGIPPFAVSAAGQDVAEKMTDSIDEFEHLKKRIIDLHAPDFRRWTAEKFAKWRKSVIAEEWNAARVKRERIPVRSTGRVSSWLARSSLSAWEVLGICSVAVLISASIAFTGVNWCSGATVVAQPVRAKLQPRVWRG